MTVVLLPPLPFWLSIQKNRNAPRRTTSPAAIKPDRTKRFPPAPKILFSQPVPAPSKEVVSEPIPLVSPPIALDCVFAAVIASGSAVMSVGVPPPPELLPLGAVPADAPDPAGALGVIGLVATAGAVDSAGART